MGRTNTTSTRAKGSLHARLCRPPKRKGLQTARALTGDDTLKDVRRLATRAALREGVMHSARFTRSEYCATSSGHARTGTENDRSVLLALTVRAVFVQAGAFATQLGQAPAPPSPPRQGTLLGQCRAPWPPVGRSSESR
eukprot:6048630-Pyramimonas_sp.AAC.1